jgi:hypothetical protein
MLKTDLNGLINELKDNKIIQMVLFIVGCFIIYCLVAEYWPSKNNFGNVVGLQGGGNSSWNGNSSCKGDIPKIDEAIIRNMIELPNRDPKMLTTSMVIPEKTISQETQKQTRMEVLNMFYNSFDDDLTSIKSRPQGLYVIP